VRHSLRTTIASTSRLKMAILVLWGVCDGGTGPSGTTAVESATRIGLASGTNHSHEQPVEMSAMGTNSSTR